MAEYEVESILRAKVVGDGRKKPKAWLYYVKWKGYDDPEDNTWEPPKSFKGGSEHFIDHFWDSVDTGGRDVKTIRLFSVDEEFSVTESTHHHKGKELAEEEIASPPAETPVESVQDRHSVISLSSDDEPDPSPRRSKRPRPSSADTEPVAPKRKRGRPPGINAKDAEQILSGTKAPTAKRSTRDLRRVARQEEESAVEESSMSASTARPLPPLPRRRGRPPKEPLPHSSPSTDELVLLPKVGETSRKRRSKKHGTTAAEAMDVDEEPSRPPSPFGVPTLLEPQSEKPTDTSSPRVPAHRVRAANPRVKIADDPNLSEVTGVIAVKAKFMKPSTSTNGPTNGESSASSSTRKPGPGRSSSGFLVGGSRLTAQKGKLITVKPTKSLSRDGDADAEPMNNDFPTFELVEEAPQEPPAEPQAPPTGQELLDAAGLNTVAEDLPDFEEDAEGEIDLEYVAEIASSQSNPNSQSSNSEQINSVPQPSVVEVPQAVPILLEAKPVTFANRVAAAWNQSTIFGPLALGFSRALSPAPPDAAVSSKSKVHALYLNLDPAVTLPIMLEDGHASDSFLGSLDKKARSPTGKFYKEPHASALVDTLRPEGSFARMVLGDTASDDDKQHFNRFVSRLLSGELFIQMNRAQTLAICHSENAIVGQKLSVPAELLGANGSVVVAHVNVHDLCKYAEAVVNADDARW